MITKVSKFILEKKKQERLGSKKINESNDNAGLIVKGSTPEDTEKLKDFAENSGYYAEFTEDGNYFFFPEEPANFDALENALQKEFDQLNISVTFEGQGTNERKKSKYFTKRKVNENRKFKKINESDDDDDEDEDSEEDGELDMSDIEWKMDKFMSDDMESMDMFYDIMDNESMSRDEKIAELEDYFDNNIQDNDRFDSYLGPNRTLNDFCIYLVDSRKTNEKRRSKFSNRKKMNERNKLKFKNSRRNKVNEQTYLAKKVNALIKDGKITKDQSVEQLLELFGFGKKTYQLDDTFTPSADADTFYNTRKDLVKVYTAPLMKQGMDADTAAKAVKALKMFVGDGIPQLKDYNITYDSATKKLTVDPNGKGLFNGSPVMG